ncbi:MAG TPA: phenylalanine--tRNA ligase subunit beta [Solirubrobacteraceae bacterium]|jgi:phenylalanyl-tRNA synthetase beta chain|nr:phenylalanine--tRNA ligase subunit beta [Solirubrobacteraceae bacterium]
MRVPLKWLHEYCAPDLDAFALAERLAMTGTEVERVERHGVTALQHFVVGKVLGAEPHPDADRLRVCQVDTGDGEPSQIVCGAPNVAAGQTVAVAKPGSVMPDGSKLKVAKLRGQPSNGMILAEDEVGIGTDHAGIMVLDDALEAGTPLDSVLPIATDVLVLEVTPNRPDCLGIYGVAREVHAATGAPLAPAPWREDPAELAPPAALDAVRITVECPDLCPRFTARAFEDVAIGPSPAWLKARLMAAGQRPISNIVDITNYVMLLTGQPLHAFDLDRIAGAQLTIRQARDGETMQTLDGQTRRLDADMVLIADDEGPTSIAGVMGGARSEVGDSTTRVLMEVANWDGANIHRTSLKLGLRSEASGRNEKGLQPEQCIEAQAIATQLMVELCGARVVPGTIDVGGDGPPLQTVVLRDARVTSLLGVAVPRERCAEILTALEFTPTIAPDGLDVVVPAFRRTDVTREADLIEEVARLGALQDLPATLPSRHGAWGRLTDIQRLRRSAADALIAQGLYEIVGWSFEGAEQVARLRIADRPVVELENPMSADQSRLRTTLLGSLLDVGRRNRSRGAAAVRLFEAGAVYLPDPNRPGALPSEPYHVAALVSGPVRPATWRRPEPGAADFFAAKGVLGAMLDTVHVPWTIEADSQTAPFLHPGRAARIVVGGTPAGWIGEIHPQVAAGWDWDDPVAAFELDLDAAAGQVRFTAYEDVTSFPEIREDLAVIVADTVTAAQVLDVVREAGGNLLGGAEVFDVYRDEQRIGAGNVSLAVRLRFRAPDRTLTDEEVATRRRKIASALTSQLQGRVRDS